MFFHLQFLSHFAVKLLTFSRVHISSIFSPQSSLVVHPYPCGICSKTPSSCLKLWIVVNPVYTVFSYTYMPIIKFHL